MAQRRMIDKKISVSEQVANLPTEAQLIFTWSIPHADDLGLLPYSHRTLKAMILPMIDMRVETFGNHMETILAQGLYEIFEYEGEKYYKIIKFLNNQTLKKDRKPNTHLNNINNWSDVEAIGFQMEDEGNPSKDKISKDKISKVKIREENKKDYLSKIPKKDIEEFMGRFMVSEKQIKSKAEDLLNYCIAKGKIYRNYRAFLLNALKKDFGQREKDPFFKGNKLKKDGDNYYFMEGNKRFDVPYEKIKWK